MPVVAGVLRREDGCILLAKRRPGGAHGGLWEFPGGKIEAGETPREALVRELREELGVEVVAGDELLRVEHAYPHLAILLIAVEVRLASGVPRPVQCQELAWVPPGELLSRSLPEADEPIARLLAEAPAAT
jgi:mutator protein MutT